MGFDNKIWAINKNYRYTKDFLYFLVHLVITWFQRKLYYHLLSSWNDTFPIE